MEELTRTQEEDKKTVYELQQRIAQLEEEQLKLKSKIPPGISLQDITFKHKKTLECLRDIDKLLASNQFECKDKILEISNYVTYMERKLENLNKQIKTKETEVSSLKKQIDQLCQDINMTNNGFMDLKTKHHY